jgi:2-methylaconitate cis-trans-isomerase PrpF
LDQEPTIGFTYFIKASVYISATIYCCRRVVKTISERSEIARDALDRDFVAVILAHVINCLLAEAKYHITRAGDMERMTETIMIKCSIMRGGTSKAVFLMENHLPRDEELKKRIILSIFGSPDRRQIDGLGGADPLTSKCAVIGASNRDDADVVYSFYQVGIDSKVVKPSICGNISAAVGPFVIDENLVKATEPMTLVRIYNTHTQKVIYAEVPTVMGKAATEGDYTIDGVPGTGAKIMLDWRNVVGVETGGLLPTGNTKDKVSVEGVGEITISIVDCGNPAVFVRAEDIGLSGTEMPDRVDSDNEVLGKLELIRGAGGELAGIIGDRYQSKHENPNHPHLAIVSAPQPYSTYAGTSVSSEQVDIVSRMMFMQVMHKTYAGSGAICAGVAAKIEGTIPYELARDAARKEEVFRIGHPGGIMSVESQVHKEGEAYKIQRAAMGRTARKIMDGYVYLRKSGLKV